MQQKRLGKESINISWKRLTCQEVIIRQRKTFKLSVSSKTHLNFSFVHVKSIICYIYAIPPITSGPAWKSYKKGLFFKNKEWWFLRSEGSGGADLESGTSPIGAKFPVPLVVVVWTDVYTRPEYFSCHNKWEAIWYIELECTLSLNLV